MTTLISSSLWCRSPLIQLHWNAPYGVWTSHSWTPWLPPVSAARFLSPLVFNWWEHQHRDFGAVQWLALAFAFPRIQGDSQSLPPPSRKGEGTRPNKACMNLRVSTSKCSFAFQWNWSTTLCCFVMWTWRKACFRSPVMGTGWKCMYTNTFHWGFWRGGLAYKQSFRLGACGLDRADAS